MRRNELTRSKSTQSATSSCLRRRFASSSSLQKRERQSSAEGRRQLGSVLQSAFVLDKAVVGEQDEHLVERDTLERLFGIVHRLVV